MSSFNWPKPTKTHKQAPGARDTHACRFETSRTTSANADNAATASVVYILALPSPASSREETQVVVNNNVDVMAVPATATPSLRISTLMRQTEPLDLFASATTLVTLPVPTAVSETRVGDTALSTDAGDARIFVLATPNPDPSAASTLSTPAADVRIFGLATSSLESAPESTPEPTYSLSPPPSPSPSPPDSTSLTPPPPPSHNLSPSAVLGITAGTLALVALLTILSVILHRRRRRKGSPKPHPATENTSSTTPPHAGMFQRAHALGMSPRLNRLLWEKDRRERVAAQEREVVEEAERMARDGVAVGGVLGTEWAARRALRSWPSGLDCHPILPTNISTIPEKDIGKAV